MPVVTISEYEAPIAFSNAHMQTIYPSLARRVRGLAYRRERILTPDDDFLDIDWAETGSEKAVIISHGLEGSSHRSYVKGMVRHLNNCGYDTAAWNFRGCSGEINRKPQFYHSGATYDLHTVAEHVALTGRYEQIYFVGFSMGGNITLKYLADYHDRMPRQIISAVALSVPCDLPTSAVRLGSVAGGLYMYRFMRMLKEKVRRKHAVMPDKISVKGLDGIKDFEEFDNRYTAPLHGFKDAVDYWEKASSKPVLKHIKRPALLVNAKDDPFLTPGCFPVEEAWNNPYLTLEMPEKGGHVGFIQLNGDGAYWSERRASEFLSMTETS